MRALLDVNVLIALFDPNHAFHNRSHDWWRHNAGKGWASCPMTENALIRILANPGYSQNARFTPNALIESLRRFVRDTNHEFWPDDLSLRDETTFISSHLHGSRSLTDVYLLALATRRQGRLATFDQGIPNSAVRGATSSNLVVI